MISFVDVLPTRIEAAGGSPPADVDGRSFLNVLRGQKQVHREVIFAVQTTKGIIQGSVYPIRSVRNERFKHIRNLNANGVFTNLVTESNRMDIWQSWKAKTDHDPFAARRMREYQHRPAEELYDLKHDPYGMNNLAADSAYAKIRDVLSDRLDRWMSAQNDKGLAAELPADQGEGSSP